MMDSLRSQAETWTSWGYDHRVANTTTNGTIFVTPVSDAAAQRFREEDARLQRQREIDSERIRQTEFQRSAERIAAKERAEKLLQSALSPEQREELKIRGFFHCRSKVGIFYRIYRGSHGNVRRLNHTGKEIERLCVQPSYVPESDCMLAQKLHIENDEQGFRRTANIIQLN